MKKLKQEIIEEIYVNKHLFKQLSAHFIIADKTLVTWLKKNNQHLTDIGALEIMREYLFIEVSELTEEGRPYVNYHTGNGRMGKPLANKKKKEIVGNE